MIKLMYITNDVNVAAAIDAAGVDRVFIDLEYLYKAERQAGRDTVMSKHTLDDVRRIKGVLNKSELLVRVNPINEGSSFEIDSAIINGADILMLPMFKTAEEVKTFISLVDGRCKTMLLIEHIDAVNCLTEILSLDGIDECHIGLNDLHISLNKKFMFELLADGTVDKIMDSAKRKNIPIGIGGMSKLGTGTLPADLILCEHYRLGSSGVILSRGFANVENLSTESEIYNYFKENIEKIREREVFLSTMSESYFEDKHKELVDIVTRIMEG